MRDYMNCKNCNAPINDNAKFCKNCGAKITSSTPRQPATDTYCDNESVTESARVENPTEALNVESPAEIASDETPTESANVESSAEVTSNETPAEVANVENSAEVASIENSAEVTSNETPAETAGIQLPVAGAEAVTQNPGLQNPGFQNAVQPDMFNQENILTPVKKKSKKKIIIIVAAIVAVLAVVFVFLFPTIRRMVMPANQYLQMVESESAKNASNSIGNLVGNFKANGGKQSTEGNISLKLDSKGSQIIKDNTNADLSWLSDANINFSTNRNDNLIQLKGNLQLNNSDLLSQNIVFDYANGVYYITIPELSDKTLKFDLNQALPSASTDYSSSMNSFKEIYNVIPDENVTKNIINRYTAAVIKQINNVQKTDTAAEVNGVYQKCTLLTAVIDKATVKNICINALNELKSDNDIRTIIQNYCSIEDANANFDDVYSNFISSIDNALSSVNNDNIFDEFTQFEYKVWVDYSDKIIGRGIYYGGQDIHYLDVQNNGQFGYEFDAGLMTIKGSGATNNNGRTGKFTLSANGISICNVDVENAKYDKLPDEISGTYVFSLSEGVASSIMAGYNGSNNYYEDYDLDDIDDLFNSNNSYNNPLSLLTKLKLKLDINANKENCDLNLSLLSDKDSIVSLGVFEKLKEPEIIALPDESNVIYADDNMDMQNWIDKSKSEELMRKLTEIGLPGLIS